MSVHKVIEVKAQSPKGWEDAARMAVAEAAETVNGIKGIWIEGMQGVVEGGKITVPLGSRTIEVIHVGPAHTRGDVIVYSPSDRVVYTGDVMFIGGHPVIWVGPWSNWIRACETILSLDVDVIVPGHGRIVDKAGAREMLEWIIYLKEQARGRYDAGLSLEDTVREIEVYFPISEWIDRDRIVTNVNLLFHEFGGRGALKDMDDVIRLQEKLGLMEPLHSASGDHHGHAH